MKSKVMIKAHQLFNGNVRYWNIYDFSKFSDCLRRAWVIVKDNEKYEAEKMAVESEKKRLEDYRNSPEYKAYVPKEVDLSFIYDVPCGTYVGD